MSETLNELQMQKVTDWLTERGIFEQPCGGCGQVQPKTIDNRLAGVMGSIRAGVMPITAAHIPLLVVSCDHCAHVQTFLSRTIGVGSSGFKF